MCAAHTSSRLVISRHPCNSRPVNAVREHGYSVKLERHTEQKLRNYESTTSRLENASIQRSVSTYAQTDGQPENITPSTPSNVRAKDTNGRETEQ